MARYPAVVAAGVFLLMKHGEGLDSLFSALHYRFAPREQEEEVAFSPLIFPLLQDSAIMFLFMCFVPFSLCNHLQCSTSGALSIGSYTLIQGAENPASHVAERSDADTFARRHFQELSFHS